MAFTINDEASTNILSTDQSEIDKVHFDILAAAHAGNGVVSGCVVTAQGTPNMTVAVASGIVRVAGSNQTVTGANVTITAADATLNRYDLIVSDNTGVLSATAGTPLANPVDPDVPANSVALAEVYIPAAATTIQSTQIVDKRMILLPSAHHAESHDNNTHTTAGTPAASAVGDAGAQGSSASVARLDHLHGREAFVTPALVLSTSNAAGAATTLIRSDAQLALFDVTTPAATGTAATGSAAFAARRDHVHASNPLATDTLWAAKGDIVAATANDTASVLSVGTAGQVLHVDSTATRGVDWRDEALNWDKPTGAISQTLPRTSATTTSQTVLTDITGKPWLQAIWLPKGVTCTSITWVGGTTAESNGTHCIFGLYDSARALLRATTDQTGATFFAASTANTISLTSTYQTTTSGLYYLAILVVQTSGTMPTIRGLTVGGGTTVQGLAPIICGLTSDTAQTTMPANAGTISAASTSFCYGYVS